MEKLDLNLKFHLGIVCELIFLQYLFDFIAPFFDHIANLLLVVLGVVLGGLNVAGNHIFDFEFLFDLVPVEGDCLLGELLPLVGPDVGMNNGDAQGGGHGDVADEVLVGEDLGPQLIHLGLG